MFVVTHLKTVHALASECIPSLSYHTETFSQSHQADPFSAVLAEDILLSKQFDKPHKSGTNISATSHETATELTRHIFFF